MTTPQLIDKYIAPAVQGSWLKRILDSLLGYVERVQSNLNGHIEQQALINSQTETSLMSKVSQSQLQTALLEKLDVATYDEQHSALRSQVELNASNITDHAGAIARLETDVSAALLEKLDVATYDEQHSALRSQDERSRHFERIDMLRSLDGQHWTYLCPQGSTIGGKTYTRDTWVSSSNKPTGFEQVTAVAQIPASITELKNAFDGCTALEELDVMSYDFAPHTVEKAFQNCSSLASLDLSDWNMANCYTIGNTFRDCIALESVGDISGWDMHFISNMAEAFRGCASLKALVIQNWNLQRCNNLSHLFNGCSSLKSLDLSGWNTTAATNFACVFINCMELEYLDITGWDLRNCTTTVAMFANCNSLRTFAFSEGLFTTTAPLQLDAPNLGLNADNSSNGWLELLANVAPTITTKSALNLPDDAPLIMEDENERMALTDGAQRTIVLHSNLKNKEWATPLLARLVEKGYEIA